MNNTARIIESDGIQMVQLPAGFRFDVSEVIIQRLGSGILLKSVEEHPRNTLRNMMRDHVASPDFMLDRSEGPVLERPCDIMSGRLTEDGYAPIAELSPSDQTWDDFFADDAEFSDFMTERPLNTMIEESDLF